MRKTTQQKHDFLLCDLMSEMLADFGSGIHLQLADLHDYGTDELKVMAERSLQTLERIDQMLWQRTVRTING